MPNTIAHFAINGLFTRRLIKHADFKWVYLGCVVPDLPWILQRLILALPVSLNLYDLRAYFVVQSSLAWCILISFACASLAQQRNKVFIILIIGCLLHLLLDAMQIKWANGVLLFAPLDWGLQSIDLFWPESLGTYALMAAGLGYFVFNLNASTQPNRQEFVASVKSLSLCGVALLAWLALPLLFIQSVYTADHHYISTLKNVQIRAGKSIEIDRSHVSLVNGVAKLNTSYGEVITLENISLEHPALVSLQGKFTGNSTIRVDNYHVHSGFRNIASILGLLCVLLVWAIFMVRSFALKPKPP